MISDNKPGVIGAIGNLGQSVKQATVTEVKKTVENTVEQLGVKERKEGAPDAAAVAQAEAMRKQQSKDVANWLYGTSEETPSTPLTPAPVEQKSDAKAVDVKTQLGFGEKPQNTANVTEQLGFKTETPNTTTVNPLEQITDQLNFNPAPTKTPEEQQKAAQLRQQLHSQYYQRLTTPQKPAETEERMKEAQEEQETKEQRMERLKNEDLQEEQKKKEKQQPLAVDQAQNMEKNRGSSG